MKLSYVIKRVLYSLFVFAVVITLNFFIPDWLWKTRGALLPARGIERDRIRDCQQYQGAVRLPRFHLQQFSITSRA